MLMEEGSFNREQIVEFLERCVFKTLTPSAYPEQFNTIISALKMRYCDSEKFSDETLQKITAIKIDRDYNKRLQVAIQYEHAKKWHNISWTSMYSSKPARKKQPTHHSKVISAFRHHIKDQITNYNSTRFGIRKCQICDCFDNLEVDHTKPNTFGVLLHRYLSETNTKEENIKVYWSGTSWKLSNDVLREQWYIFHQTHATFRLLCGDCNKKNW